MAALFAAGANASFPEETGSSRSAAAARIAPTPPSRRAGGAKGGKGEETEGRADGVPRQRTTFFKWRIATAPAFPSGPRARWGQSARQWRPGRPRQRRRPSGLPSKPCRGDTALLAAAVAGGMLTTSAAAVSLSRSDRSKRELRRGGPKRAAPFRCSAWSAARARRGRPAPDRQCFCVSARRGAPPIPAESPFARTRPRA